MWVIGAMVIWGVFRACDHFYSKWKTSRQPKLERKAFNQDNIIVVEKKPQQQQVCLEGGGQEMGKPNVVNHVYNFRG